MTNDTYPMSVIIPANNEEALIGDCLSAVARSSWPHDAPLQIIVVANGCTDKTTDAAALVEPNFAQRGWAFKIVDRAEGNKLAALNAGDAIASGGIRIYLDADVAIGRDVLAQLFDALDVAAPRYASGRVIIDATGAVSRAYARIWRKVPFMAQGVPGCGLFAINRAGRARWGDFPTDIISDDTFARLHFTPDERVGVPAPYRWPIAEGWAALLKVRRRQDVGVDEIANRFPDLIANDGTPTLGTRGKLAMAARDPVGFAVYTSVALASRLTRNRETGWSRGR